MVLLLLWIRAAAIIYALFFGLGSFPGATEFLSSLFLTWNGIVMLIIGTLVGGLFAALGFAISGGWRAGHIWFTSLVAWVLKLTIMRYGGVSLFQTLKPFFFGLIIGEVALNGVWGFIFWLIGDRGRILSYM